ncbi:hypothetical protein LTR49_003010 [Elasticomyces elasticus]|nr:hypothetical protein LTR49_003010 [Elasticomyces elasticus]
MSKRCQSFTDESKQEPDGSAPKRARWSTYNDVFTILAGVEESPFIIHKDRLCQSSDFLTAACSRDWKEGKEKTIRLHTIESTTFELYIEWVYCKEVHLAKILPAARVNGYGPHTLEGRAEEVRQLVKLYIAGDKLLDERVKNTVMDELSVRSDAWPKRSLCIPPDAISSVWESSPDSSPLRKMMLNSFASTHDVSSIESFEKTAYPYTFFYDLAIHQMLIRDLEPLEYRPKVDDHCFYHNHTGPDEVVQRAECHRVKYKSLLSRAHLLEQKLMG